MRALAFVLIAIGLLFVARAIPPGMAKKAATSTTTLATALVVVLVTGALTLLTHDEPPKLRPARADRVGVCADAAVQPRCTELYESVTAALEVLAAAPLDAGTARPAPVFVVPGRGDLHLLQTVTTLTAPAVMSEQLTTAFTATGWATLPSQAGLLRFQRAPFTAVVRITPAGAGARVVLTAAR